MSGTSEASPVVPPRRAAMHFIASRYSGTGMVRRRCGNCGKVARRCFMPGRNKAFDAVVEPVGGQLLFRGDAASQFADGLSRLKERVHIFGREACGEGQHHDCAAEEAEFAGDALLAEFIGKGAQGAREWLRGSGRSRLVVVRSCDFRGV